MYDDKEILDEKMKINDEENDDVNYEESFSKNED